LSTSTIGPSGYVEHQRVSVVHYDTENEHWEEFHWKLQGSPAEKHFEQKKEKKICKKGHEGHQEMGREYGRAKVRSCVVISAAAGRYGEAPSEPRFGFRW
jgi:hypothetical protein